MTATEWLEKRTGRSAAWWVAAVQQAVQKASSPSDDPNHDQTDPNVWVQEVAKLVIDSLPPDNTIEFPFDGNMRIAAILGLVLSLWYARLGYAKSHSPSRPVSLRIPSYKNWLTWTQALIDAVFNESEDAVFFPGQEWDFPFGPHAKNGNFV